MTEGTPGEEVAVGDRVRLIRMVDPSGLEPGNEGTVVHIGEVCAADIEGSPNLKHLMGRRNYWVEWDRAGTMAMIEGVDHFEVVLDR